MPDVDLAFEEHRPALTRLAYRMLGSLADADDVLQEAYLRWAREDREAVGSPKSYLYAMVTNLCIDHQRARDARRERYVGPWLPEPVVEPAETRPTDRAEIAESVSLAFLVLLESLSPVERAAYLLRRVFDYAYEEIAELLGKSEANCRQLVSRAEASIDERRPRFEPDPSDADRIAREFLHACTTGDLDGLTRLLGDEAVLYSDGGGKVKAALVPIHGADKIARFLLGILKKAPPDMRIYPVRVNGQPGFLATESGSAVSVTTFGIDQGRVRQVFVVSNPEKLTRVELPGKDSA
jgi:RNA polymerase sigma-70 factor, ECF subfamily